MRGDLEKALVHPVVKYLRAKEIAKYDEQYFAEHYWREDLPGKTGNKNLSYDDPYHEKRFQFLFDTLVGGNAWGRVLDTGCGPGHLLQRILNSGVEAYGIDCSYYALQNFRSSETKSGYARAMQGQLHQLPFSDDAFNLSICLDVLEHLLVFDAVAAVHELCRVTSEQIICSINLDNPYEFHNTILSRDSWNAVFESTNLVRLDEGETRRLNSLVKARYVEYDFFVFRKL